jgi:peroxiredoxin
MRARPDLLVFGIVVALAVYVVVWQTNSPDLDPMGIRPLAIGQKAPDFTLTDIGGKPRRLADEGNHGRVATVLYFWSVSCPCVDEIEDRMKQVYDAFPRKRGFEYVGIDADPEDDAPEVIAKMGRIYAFYRMLLDPEQTTAARLGGRSAGEVVVLDRHLRLRYRGSIDDDFKKPKRFYLMEVLKALEEERPISPPFETPGYGCPFPGIEGVCATEAAASS